MGIATTSHRSFERALDRLGLRLTRSPAGQLVRLLHHAGVDLVLDVGAAKGNYGVALRARGFEGSIVSFEPLRTANAMLERAAEGDPKWFVQKMALGNTVGVARINVAGNSDSSSLLSMLPAHSAAAPEANYIGEEEVQVSRLDDVFPEFEHLGMRPFLKLDAQGFERQILEGATHTLGLIRGIQIEISFVPLYQGAMIYDEALELLRSQGFTLAMMSPAFTSRIDGRWLQADALLFRE